jgi:glycosyltransferase involved in cell wall biosynthesis
VRADVQQRATIERCLRSVLDQDGVEFEIVVVDDNSSDESAAIAATMLRPGDRLIRNESRAGLSGNHNKCLEHARGRFIQFVHGDDWLLPGALQTLAGCFASPTAIRIIVGVWWLPAWLTLPLEAAVFGPQRWSRLKTLALAPVHEFAHARRLRDDRLTAAAVMSSTRGSS